MFPELWKAFTVQYYKYEKKSELFRTVLKKCPYKYRLIFAYY